MRLQADTVVTTVITMRSDSCTRCIPRLDTITKSISIKQERPDTAYIQANILPITSTISWAFATLVGLIVLRKQLALVVMILIKKIGSAKEITIGGPNGLNLKNCDVISNDETMTPAQSLLQPSSIDAIDVSQQRILSTLFKHQKEYFPQNEGKWTFSLSSGHPEFSKFLIARSKLKATNLIGKLQNEQIYLTDSGIQYCTEHSPGAFSYFE